MSKPFKFEISIALTNDENRDEVVFEEAISGQSENDLISAGVTSEWHRANGMAVERADDGTSWDVEIRCTKITEIKTGATDWENDLMPQRDEVSAFLQQKMTLLPAQNA